MSHPHEGPDDVAGSFQARVTMPLLLSLMAGLSTCLGAAVVFCARRPENNNRKQNNNSTDHKNPVPTLQSPLGHHHMAFALSLAASVMWTVSFASILPESFQDEGVSRQQQDSEEPQYHLLALGSREFGERCVSFVVGCLLYSLLSKCAFPEPDDILGLDDVEVRIADTGTEIEIGDVPDTIQVSSRPKRKQYASAAFKRKRTQQVQRDERGHDDPDDDDADTSSLTSSLIPILSSDDNDEYDKNGEELRRDRTVKTFCSAWSGKDLTTPEARRAWRVAMLLFVSLAVHNFPEGLAVAASTLHSQSLGITTTVAIALHNIPEGIAIAVPCLAARPDAPCLAFGLASLSGLAEPLGAVVALLVIAPPAAVKSGEMSTNTGGETPTAPLWDMKNVLAFVAGIMIMVAALELFPEARRHSKDGKTALVAGTLTGIVVMLASDAVLIE